MQGLRHQFFAAARFAQDEYGRTGGGDRLDLLPELLHGRAFADHLLEGRGLTEAALQVVAFAAQAGLGVLEPLEEIGRVEHSRDLIGQDGDPFKLRLAEAFVLGAFDLKHAHHALV